jgi:hypothetical protein
MISSWLFLGVCSLTLSQLMSHICGVSKTFSEWYQKTIKTKDTNKLTLLTFKIIAILHNTRLATFIKLLETLSKGLFRSRTAATRSWIAAVRQSKNVWQLFCDRLLKRPLLTGSRSFMNVIVREKFWLEK